MAATDTVMLEGKVAVVSGGGGGVGGAICKAFAAAGARVVVNDLGVAIDGRVPSTGPADAIVEEIRLKGGEAVADHTSIASMEGGRALVRRAIDTYGSLDVVACAAGILRPASIFELSEEDWDAVIGVNLKGTFALIQPACVAMREQQSGSIITFTSTGGLEGNPKQPNYSASKEGIVGLTRAVALSIAPYARCNAISPTGKSRMTDLMAPADRVTPDSSFMTSTAVFLASDASRSVTGQVVAAGGERVAVYPQPRPFQTAFRAGGWSAEQVATLWNGGGFRADPLVRYDRYVPPTR